MQCMVRFVCCIMHDGWICQLSYSKERFKNCPLKYCGPFFGIVFKKCLWLKENIWILNIYVLLEKNCDSSILKLGGKGNSLKKASSDAMKLIARTSFHKCIVILQRRAHCTPMKKVKVKKLWSKWAYGWNFMGYLLARGDFLKAVNLQKSHSFWPLAHRKRS